MAKSASVVGEMLGLLAKAGEKELAEIDEIIAAREAELAEYCQKKQGEIDSLREIRKVCDIRLNGKPQRGRWRRTDADSDTAGIPTATVQRLADWIAQRLEERGPQTTSELAIARSASESAIRIAIGKAKGRFEMDDEERWSVVE